MAPLSSGPPRSLGDGPEDAHVRTSRCSSHGPIYDAISYDDYDSPSIKREGRHFISHPRQLPIFEQWSRVRKLEVVSTNKTETGRGERE
jgi:hypothetical protein